MQTRNKYILFIIAGWLFFIVILLGLSAYLSLSGFSSLEKKITVDNTNRVMRVMLNNLERIYLPNSDYAYWDDTYNFIKNKNPAYVDQNISEDFFKSNKINYIILLDNAGNVVLNKGYDFTKSTGTAVPQEMISFLQKNNNHLVNYRNDYHDLLKKEYGLGAMLPLLPNNDIVFFVINAVNNTKETEAPNGYIIFAKTISQEFMNNMSHELGYSIQLIPVSVIQPGSNEAKVLQALTTNDTVKVETVDEQTIHSYLLLKDVNFKPIALMQIVFPRILYAEGIDTFLKNSLIVLLFALIGMFSMSALVYAFFKKQELITNSFERFVPHELIELLDKKSILEVILGTNSKRNLTVLFMDIRNFTTISEGLSPQESFDFLNTILRDIAPIVIKNHGFIDKYIGDAIMALFPNHESSADDAVASAMMILDEMDKINYTGKLKSMGPVKVGIGINTGHSILGIIGAEGRLEGTVISDAVNVASRIQALTKVYGNAILISEETYHAMKHAERYQITHVEDAELKGKTIRVSLYKVEKR